MPPSHRKKTNDDSPRKRGAYQSVREHVLQTYGEGDWLPPELEIARQLGVSRYAVTKALNELFNQGIVRREAGRGTQYLSSPSSTPTSRPQRVHSHPHLAFISGELNSPLAFGLICELQRLFSGRGVFLALRSTDHSGGLEATRLDELKSGGFDGAIVIPDHLEHTSQEIQRLHEEGFPIVAVDRVSPHVQVPFVTSDHASGAHDIVAHLVQLGHRRIAHVTYAGDWPANHPVSLRLAGYRSALKEAGIPFDPALIERITLPENLVTPDTEKRDLSAYIATHRLIAASSPPTAVFAVNDYLCASSVQAIQNHGLLVPSDISVAGFDHDTSASPPGLEFTSCAHPVREMAEVLAEFFLPGGRIPRTELPLREIIQPRFMVGNSSASPR